MTEKVSCALTVGEIARQTNQPVHRIEYIIRSRNIQPNQRAGNARVFSKSDFEFIASEIKRIDKEGVSHGRK